MLKKKRKIKGQNRQNWGYENMGMKQFRPPIERTVVCYWCGCTNHSDALKTVSFFRIDGIMGDCACWDKVKDVLMELGLAEEKTLMRDVMKIITKTRRHIKEFGLRDNMGNKITNP